MYYLTGNQQAAFVLVISTLTANTAGHTKKVVTSATLVVVGICVVNIAGPFFYKDAQAPGYSLGIVSMVVSYVVEACLILGLAFLLARDN